MQPTRKRTVYLLIILILLNLLFPLSEINLDFARVYVSSYSLLLGVGVYTAAVTRGRFLIALGLALGTLAALLVWLADPANLQVTLAAFIALVIYQVFLIGLLLEYIFTVRQVSRSVLYAGVSVYLLIADVFTPIHMSLEIVTRLTTGSPAYLMVLTPDVPIQWQQMIYFSFITLTTAGYGDILPVTSVARMFAIFEAVIGVLYLAILMARLVSLYSERGVEDPQNAG